jgi:hypothetical protein
MLDTQPVFQCTEGQVSISVGREDGSQSRVPEVEGVVTALDDIPKLAGFALQLPILMSVSNGADVALPSGRYEFQQSRLALGHQFPATTCQVSAGGHIKVALVESLEYQPVRLTVTSTEGARIAFFTVNLRANNRSESVSWARSEGAPICYLATGQYKGEIYVQGFDKCEFDMLVGDGRGECEQAFVVSREAR